jgi:hypothetical protein
MERLTMNVLLIRDPTSDDIQCDVFADTIEHQIARSVHTIQSEIKELFDLTHQPEAHHYLLRESKDILAACADLQTVYQRINRVTLQAAE